LLRLSGIQTDIAGKGARKTWGGLLLALSSGLMFVACYGDLIEKPIFHQWFWAVFFAASAGSLLWSRRFTSSLQSEHGSKTGLIAYLINTSLVLPIDLVVFLYAFCSPEVWQQA